MKMSISNPVVYLPRALITIILDHKNHKDRIRETERSWREKRIKPARNCVYTQLPASGPVKFKMNAATHGKHSAIHHRIQSRTKIKERSKNCHRLANSENKMCTSIRTDANQRSFYSQQIDFLPMPIYIYTERELLTTKDNSILT